MKHHARLGFCCLFFAIHAAHGITFSPFGPHGEGGRLHGQTLTIGTGGAVYELDSYLRIEGLDLNGSASGQSACLSRDTLPAGLVYTFTPAGTNGTPTLLLTYSFSNSTATAFHNLQFLFYLDAEIDEATTTFYNEYGEMGGSLGTGAGDATADSWRIDEPGFTTGTIISELQAGSLANRNDVPQTNPNDVAMALGFQLDDLAPGQCARVKIQLSEAGETMGGLWLHHHDADQRSTTTITLSGAAGLSMYGLTVLSEYGQGNPATGEHAYPPGQMLSCSITNSPIQSGLLATQYVCAGWAGTGSVPASGVGTSTPSFALLAESSIVWLWQTNYYVTILTNGAGSVDVTSAWHSAGSVRDVTATAAAGWTFAGWTGDTNGAAIAGNRLSFHATRPLTIQAGFIRANPPENIVTNAAAFVTLSCTWQLDRQTGWLIGTLQLACLSGSPALAQPFQIVLHNAGAIQFRHPSGTLPNGDSYLDISAAMINALQNSGNRDAQLDPGETNTITGIEIFTPNRAPPATGLIQFWAELIRLPL